jgi:hypothetical protein
MKYIINHRYKVLHSIKVTVSSILSICERGRSKDLSVKLDSLMKLVPEIKIMMAPPFGEKMNGHLKKLHSDVEEFLLLPDDFEKRGNKIIQAIKPLLQEIDPFHFAEDETPNIRRSQIVELAQNLQIYLQRTILNLQGRATSLFDEKHVIGEMIGELDLISLEPFDEKEKQTVEELFSLYLVYNAEPILSHAQMLLTQAIYVESAFKSEKKNKK